MWRRRWDSNPRAVAGKLISSQPRYDHFDTSPEPAHYTMQTSLPSNLFFYLNPASSTAVFPNILSSSGFRSSAMTAYPVPFG